MRTWASLSNILRLFTHLQNGHKNTCSVFFTGGGQSDVRKSTQQGTVELSSARGLSGWIFLGPAQQLHQSEFFGPPPAPPPRSLGLSCSRRSWRPCDLPPPSEQRLALLCLVPGWATCIQCGCSSCCSSVVSQQPRQMRCPWRPSCLSECGNSGLPRAEGWERKRNGPC